MGTQHPLSSGEFHRRIAATFLEGAIETSVGMSTGDEKCHHQCLFQLREDQVDSMEIAVRDRGEDAAERLEERLCRRQIQIQRAVEFERAG
jgi:hypothetical protein